MYASVLAFDVMVTQRQSETSPSVMYGFDGCSQQSGCPRNGYRGV